MACDMFFLRNTVTSAHTFTHHDYTTMTDIAQKLHSMIMEKCVAIHPSQLHCKHPYCASKPFTGIKLIIKSIVKMIACLDVVGPK